MKQTARRIITAALSLTLAAALTSCSTVKTETPPEMPSTEEQTSTDTGKKRDEIVLNLYIPGDPVDLMRVINQFNAADNGYRVELQKEEKRFDENGSLIPLNDEEGHYRDMELVQRLTTKGDVDIVCSASFYDGAYYEILKNKGAFADLYTFMADDPEVNTDTLDNHILKLNETDGRLCSLPLLYSIDTLYGEKKYVGTTENWTFDEFLEHWNAMPEGSTISGSLEKNSVYYVALRDDNDRFIDYENAEVHFDSPEFRRILEFCSQFQPRAGVMGEYNYEVPMLVKQFKYSAIIGAHMFTPESDYTFVGYPTESRRGAKLAGKGSSYSISAASSPEKQKAAWEFLRIMWTEEEQIKSAIKKYPEGAQEMGLCVNRKAFDAIAKGIIDHEYYPETIRDDEGEEQKMQLPTEEDVAAMRRYIESIDRWQPEFETAVFQIVREETGEYFAGEITIDQCIDRIQNRASIWISEQS